MTFRIRENRCFLHPRDSNRQVVTLSGRPCRIVRGAAAGFSFLFRDVDESVLAVNNITSIYLRIVSQSGTTVYLDKVLSPHTLVDGVTEDEFTSGAGQHCQFILDEADTNIAAATHLVVVWGYTAEFPGDPHAFGAGSITIEDLGFVAGSPNPPAAAPEWQSVLLADIANRQLLGENPAGRTASYVSPNGLYGLEVGIGDDGQPVFRTYQR